MSQVIQLDYAPRPWQRECHVKRQRFTVLALHRRAGKTELAIMELLDRALRIDLELPMYAYIAPFLRQAKAIAWSRIKHRLRGLLACGAASINEADLSVTFAHNGAVLRLFGADNPDALRGVRLDGVVIDEVGQVKPTVWVDIVQPALADRKGWALFIGTPAGVNLFHELYHRAQVLPGWWGKTYTVHDTDTIDHDEVERLRRDMSESSFAREFLCDWSAAGDDQLITMGDVESASLRTYTDAEVLNSPIVIGVDVARFGDDRTVLVTRRGLRMDPPLTLRGADNMAVAARISQVIDDVDPDAVFIDSGGGAGVIDRLRQLGRDPIEVPFGGAANDPSRFANRRAEMWWLMRDWVLEGGAIPRDTTLMAELSTPVYWFDSHGRRQLEPKDDIKKRLQGGSSPDIADALALTFASPVGRRIPREMRQARKRSNDYDPYTRMQ